MTDLRQLSVEGDGPLIVPLRDTTPLYVLTVVRRLPGRRVVCRGVWQGRNVFAKLFVDAQAARYAERDAEGSRALAEAGIATPELLYDGAVAGEQVRVLVYAAIFGARDLQTLLHQASPARLKLEDALVRTVAEMHAAGLVQTDLHPKNFVVVREQLYALDGDGIRRMSTLGRGIAVRNLALLISKLAPAEVARLGEWAHIYREVRGWPEDGLTPAALQAAVDVERYRATNKNVIRKVLRNCSAVEVTASAGRWVARVKGSCDADVEAVIAAPDAYLEATSAARMKSGNTCTVGLVQSGARKIVVKRYNIKNFWHGLGRALRATRASVSWSNAHMLHEFGIATPAPLALVEARWGWLRREAWLLTEFADGPDIDVMLADVQLTDEARHEIARAVAQLMRKLWLLRIEHGDMKATNLKWVDGAPLLLDLDAMRLYRGEAGFARRHARDLRRLMKNWQDAPKMAQMLQQALGEVYGNDAVLKLAGIEVTNEKI